jgi:hypothetical protein
MVIVKLYGGLGNQLFQYALGRKIAAKNSAALKLDVLTGFENDFYRRKYCLAYFNIQERFASLEEVTALTRPRMAERVRAKLLRRQPRAARTYIRERHFHFDSHVLNLPDGIYLDGYWQSEKYFIDIQEIIRKEFTVKTALTDMNLKIAKDIIKTNSICIHVRRLHGISGDKVDGHAVKTHGSASLDYYYNAIKYFSDKYNELHFFVFADETEWAEDNIKPDAPTTYITHNASDKGYEDLRLMSYCKHFIIANSTFSWWGAWLNPRKDKMVLAPSQWFGKEEQASRKMHDLLPASWIVL